MVNALNDRRRIVVSMSCNINGSIDVARPVYTTGDTAGGHLCFPHNTHNNIAETHNRASLPCVSLRMRNDVAAVETCHATPLHSTTDGHLSFPHNTHNNIVRLSQKLVFLVIARPQAEAIQPTIHSGLLHCVRNDEELTFDTAPPCVSLRMRNDGKNRFLKYTGNQIAPLRNFTKFNAFKIICALYVPNYCAD